MGATCWIGFSRGAYQVRALAGMIDKVGGHRLSCNLLPTLYYVNLQVGLIHKGNEEQIPLCVFGISSSCLLNLACDSAYELYADPTSGGTAPAGSTFQFLRRLRPSV